MSEEKNYTATVKENEQLGLFPFSDTGIEDRQRESWKGKRVLSDQQKLFVFYYLGGKLETLFNGYKSALAAGYSEQTARQSWQIKKLSQVSKAIEEGLGKMGLSKHEVKAMFADRAKADMSVLPWVIQEKRDTTTGRVYKEVELDLAKAVETGLIRYVKKFGYTKDGRLTVELVDFEDAQDKIAKIHKLYNDAEGGGGFNDPDTPLGAIVSLLNRNAGAVKKKHAPKKKRTR